VTDVPGEIASSEIEALRRRADGFTITGYRLELSGYCATCLPDGGRPPALA
jgi:hypothetical protein